MSIHELTPADYSDWLKYAGLYLFNVSHADRYRTFQKKISAPGLATKIVFDFLKSFRGGGVNVQTWRNGDVYEMAADAAWRVEQTAKSMEAIGAPRVAAKMRAAKNTSLGAMFMDVADDPAAIMAKMKDLDPAKLMEEFRGNVARALPGMAGQAGMPMPAKPAADTDVEAREQIEHLLDRFVKSHESELRGDMTRHGDPRTQPGFDPDKRMAELDRLRKAEYDREAQREAVPKMTKLMDDLETKLAQNPKLKPGKVAKERREILACYRQYADRPADELLPEMHQWLKMARQFQEGHADLFQPRPIKDKELLKRLAELGEYDVDMGNKNVKVSWDAPNGFACDWTMFSLSIKFPLRDAKTLASLLDTCERVRKQFSRHQAELREQVLEHFEMLREQLERIGLLDDYERDDAGNLTAESILKKAGNGSILFHNPEEYDEAGPIQVFFHVEWDDEHGLDLSIIDEPEAEPAHQTAAIANVRFSESGPPINAADVDAFEKAHDVKLPAEYRNFLLQHNGGRPEPNHLKLNMGGAPMPVYVDRLFSIPSGGNGEDELGDAIDIHRANDLPAQFAPIGTARISGEAGRGTLVLDTSGRKAGRILFANDMGGMMPDGLGEAMMAEMTSATFEQCCVAVAPSMSAFLSRLTSARS